MCCSCREIKESKAVLRPEDIYVPCNHIDGNIDTTQFPGCRIVGTFSIAKMKGEWIVEENWNR